MFGIGHLLRKIQNRQSSEVFVSDIVRLVLKEEFNRDILLNDIKIKGSVVTILNIGQTMKSEIFIRKQLLLKKINEKQQVLLVIDLK
ncbi:MAG: hypothetical protein WCK03_00315 [Candidatus Taylorbacteria bacterium]